ncbi:MAG TPA: hypothetical protein VFE85_08490 [Woeseiaceae bacterium]|nr:hypothetical protein [Woeseiaceae bacterium]
MPFIKTISPGDARDDVLDMYRRQQSAWGYVPNYARVFSHRPEVLARWGRLLAEIKRPMSTRRFELVTFAAALELRNSACALAHGKALLEFFSADDIVAIRNQDYDGVLSAAEQAMLRFARQVAGDASRITSGEVEALMKLGFSDDDVFDIATTAAGRAFFTKILDALGVECDASFSSLDDAFRKALIVGRPISCGRLERLPEQAAPVTAAGGARQHG